MAVCHEQRLDVTRTPRVNGPTELFNPRLAHLGAGRGRQVGRIAHRRHTRCEWVGLDTHFFKHLFDLIFGQAVVDRTTHMELEFVWTIQGGDHAQIHDAACFAV